MHEILLNTTAPAAFKPPARLPWRGPRFVVHATDMYGKPVSIELEDRELSPVMVKRVSRIACP